MAMLVISYSRVDQAQVRALVSLLRGGLRTVEKAVYWDDQFEPGDPWFEQLKTHIDAAPQLFVFWCDHSSASEQVRREFTYAISRHKRVVPVLLDDTPLAAELKQIHGIDLRGAVRHGDASSPLVAWLTRARGTAIALAASLMLLAGAAAWWTTGSDPGFPPGQASGSSTSAAADPDRSPEPTPRSVAPRPDPVVIEARANTSGPPELLTDASRAQIEAMVRRTPASGRYRIAVAGGSSTGGVDARTAREQGEAVRRYLAQEHAVPLDRIEVETGASEPATVDAPSGRTTVRVEAVAPADPAEPRVGLDTGAAAPSARSAAPEFVVLAGLAVAAVAAVVISTRLRRRGRRRQSIVREFERHLTGDA
jgi:hypothetical protein